MDNRQKGAASGLAITLIVIAVIAMLGIGFWWYHGATVASTTTSTDTSTTTSSYTFTIGTTTSTSLSTAPAKTVTTTHTTYVSKPVAYAGYTGTGLSGSVYHNGTYGLSIKLPSAGWRTYMTNGGPAGLPGTAQIHFVAPGESNDAFVVNVWGKAGWNYVRTQENYVHLNTSNIGEGTYLGENFTWIYSYTINSHSAEAQSALSGAVFY